ncbi:MULTISPECIES: hypothetical protein [Alcaligenes]|uniref:hypothetical protein n=1 Tax=Alcaligenes TaxID=507 RepID=UPI001F0FDF8C|nr:MULTISPECIES: hypothetical protein [Alcaligenes]MCM2621492.1 hypothetical protein [Alcaligenes faecalis]
MADALQITYMPDLSHPEEWSGEIESVHMASAARSRGLARLIIQWTIEQCRVRASATLCS